MPDIPQGWATIDAAVIAVVGGGLMTMLGIVLRRLKRVRQDTATTVFHVANEHKDDESDPINFRDDTDAKHAEVMRAIHGLSGRVGVIEKDIGGIRHELRTLHENDGEHVRQANRDRERLDELERTVPRRRPRPGSDG